MMIRRLSSQAPLIRTALYDLHVELGGKMVPFAGYELPVQYEGLGVKKEHLHCRAKNCASLFDVSHMGQIKWFGEDRAKFLESVLVGDVAGLHENEGRLSLVVDESGGIVDDTVLTNAGNHIFMVVNGACKYKDMAHFNKYIEDFQGDVYMEYAGDWGQALLALQGDGAKMAIAPLVDFDLAQMPFMNGVYTKLGGLDVRLTRCGYTGEDGFEISIRKFDAIALAKMLLGSTAADVQPCGLGARDSLRLEAGLCLYGNDITEDVNPAEAALIWTLGPVGSRRRLEQDFLGAKNFLTPDGKAKSFDKKRVGFFGHDKPARAGAAIYHGDERVGVVTSGTVSPCLGAPIAMGYVDRKKYAKIGCDLLEIDVRGKRVPTTVAKMPFVPTNYWRVPK